jgi:hypothetical protein
MSSETMNIVPNQTLTHHSRLTTPLHDCTVLLYLKGFPIVLARLSSSTVLAGPWSVHMYCTIS